MAIYKYYDGYHKARKDVESQSVEDDLNLIDALFGRDQLSYGASDLDVKKEALRQMEIDWRECENEFATLMSEALKNN